MQKMHWLESHLESVEGALRCINEFGWELSILDNNRKCVLAGSEVKQELYCATSRDIIDAFLYGMGLAYVGLPPEHYDWLVKEMAKIPVSQRRTKVANMEEAKAYANRFRWELTVIENDQGWKVIIAPPENHPIFSADSKPPVDAFLSGMGLGYVSIPETIFESFVVEVNKWFDDL